MAYNLENTLELLEEDISENNMIQEKELHDVTTASTPEISKPVQSAVIEIDDTLSATALDEIDILVELDDNVISSSKDILSESSEPIKKQQQPSTENTHTNSSFKIDSTLLEEIFEFDFSDPITEPTSVVDGDSDSSYDDTSILTKTIQSSELKLEDSPKKIAYSSPIPDSIEIEKINLSNSNKIHKDKPAIEEPFVEKDNFTPQSINNIVQTTSEPVCETIVENNSDNSLIADPVDTETSETSETSVKEDDELNIELGEKLHNLEKISDKIHQIMIEENGLKLEVDTSREHIILINNDQEYLKYQHTIMDNKCISFFWPSDGNSIVGTRISISTEKEKTFVIDMDKIDINLICALINSQRPIKILHNAKPFIAWCIQNSFNPTYIFDITTAVNVLTDGKNVDTSIQGLVHHYSNIKLDSDKIDFQSFVVISKFLHDFRKKLVDAFQTLGIIDVLNFEQKVLFPIALAEFNGMPYNENAPLPLIQNAMDLVESKYGITSKKELSRIGLLSLSKSYLSERQDLLEIHEFVEAENAVRISNNFDTKYVQDGRIRSILAAAPAGGITARGYSFDWKGLYSFISPATDFTLVEGEFKDLEVRIIAKLLNKSALFASFKTTQGAYAYFAAPLFDKTIEEVTLDEKFKAKIILEIIVRNLGERETLSYAWDIGQTFMKLEELFELKEKFKSVHPDLIKLIKKVERQAQKNKYITTSSGRISAVEHPSKAFFILLEFYMNDIFKRALELFYRDLNDYNRDYSPKITLCTIYNRIITLECDKKIVNTAIDMLTRTMSRAASKQLNEMPVAVKVYGTDQWEA